MPAESVRPAYTRAVWRLLVDGERDGATNMAIDEAILDAVVAGASPPTLRFFAWNPPCLSLGRSQPIEEVDLIACSRDGVDVVRRPTGGRAILHTDELTYSLALRQTDPRAAGDILDSYRRLSEGLLAGLRELGVEPVQAMGQRKPQAELTAVCFETPSDYEITIGDRKLVGSAQWRARGGVLQHGTLPLQGDISRIVSYLALSDTGRQAQRETVLTRATTLEEALGEAVPFALAARAMAAGFAQALNLELVPRELSQKERSMVVELCRSRYADPAWTGRI
jgi:lipoate-protein ligase A